MKRVIDTSETLGLVETPERRRELRVSADAQSDAEAGGFSSVGAEDSRSGPGAPSCSTIGGERPEHSPEFGYELMKRVVAVIIQRLQATRRQLLDAKAARE